MIWERFYEQSYGPGIADVACDKDCRVNGEVGDTTSHKLRSLTNDRRFDQFVLIVLPYSVLVVDDNSVSINTYMFAPSATTLRTLLVRGEERREQLGEAFKRLD